jgi:hypothetical protein
MAIAWMAALAVLANAFAHSSDDDPLFTRVRSTERYMIALIQEGYSRSPTFRALVDRLQNSNVIVLVRPIPCLGGRLRSCLVSVNGSERERHIRINVDPRHTIRDWLIGALGHELQHAVEIAEHPEVVDARSATALYRRLAVGRCRDGLSEECETTRALDIEKAVIDELSKRR